MSGDEERSRKLEVSHPEAKRRDWRGEAGIDGGGPRTKMVDGWRRCPVEDYESCALARVGARTADDCTPEASNEGPY